MTGLTVPLYFPDRALTNPEVMFASAAHIKINPKTKTENCEITTIRHYIPSKEVVLSFKVGAGAVLFSFPEAGCGTRDKTK